MVVGIWVWSTGAGIRYRSERAVVECAIQKKALLLVGQSFSPLVFLNGCALLYTPVGLVPLSTPTDTQTPPSTHTHTYTRAHARKMVYPSTYPPTDTYTCQQVCRHVVKDKPQLALRRFCCPRRCSTSAPRAPTWTAPTSPPRSPPCWPPPRPRSRQQQRQRP